MGKVLAEGNLQILPELRIHSCDPRWRVREGVAMALQRLGYTDMDCLISEMARWSQGCNYERRAAIAALCEPGLLREPGIISQVLGLLDRVTYDILDDNERKSADFLALKKALGYCWSVAVAANLEGGRAIMERWFSCTDKDVRWIMKENLKKNRLLKADKAWTEHWLGELNRVG